MINNLKTHIKIKKFFLFVILFVIAVFCVIKILNILIEPDSYVTPNYDKVDIESILSKNAMSDDDYKTVFYQTGLGRIAVDEMLSDSNLGSKSILEFQDAFFADNKVLCESIGIITNQETFADNKGLYKYGFELAPYKPGYVLVTKATHSLGWRHGHAAIVTNSNKGETLEAIILGQNSTTQNIDKWRMYPSFMMLKIKDAPLSELDDISKFAMDHMYDIPYDLFIGLFGDKNISPSRLKSTHCSHLVWYPFKQFGYDLDSDGSWLVTPKDLANSDLFEIVQIYGVDPADIWP